MSNIGEDLYADSHNQGQASSMTPGLTTHAEPVTHRYGREIPTHDPRKFKYDVLAGRAARPIPWHVSKDDCMGAVEAGEKLSRIHDMWGLKRENPNVLQAFNNGLFFCHTINSGSMLQPGRSVIVVGDQSFHFYEVVRLLGDDLRRFFRAYADEVTQVNQAVLDAYNPLDIEAVERHSWLMQVATERGLLKYPQLAHDSSDKCQSITPGERMAISSSKVSVFGNIVNAVDRLNANSRMPTADNYDTTNHRTVPANITNTSIN